MNFGELHLLEDSSWRVLLSAVVAVVLALVVHRVGAVVIWRITRNLPISSAVARRSWRPSRFVLPLIALQAVWQAAPDALPLISQVRHGNACCCWPPSPGWRCAPSTAWRKASSASIRSRSKTTSTRAASTPRRGCSRARPASWCWSRACR
jgi:hypothetical protein